MSYTSPNEEVETLLLCARSRMNEEEVARLRELCSRRLDWERVYRLARRHAVLPTVFTQLNSHASDQVPENFLQKFKRDFEENAARNLLLTAELEKLASEFERRGLELLAYKGPALAASAYGRITLRRFVDLDVLVRRSDIDGAQKVLAELGYRPQVCLTGKQEVLLRRAQHNLAYSREGGGVLVELHWAVTPPLYARTRSVEEMFERSVNVRLISREVRAPSPEDLLLALTVHGTKHLWERVAWIADIAEVIRSNPALNWKYLFESARELRVERMLGFGLALTERLMRTPLPVQPTPALSESMKRALNYVTMRAFEDGELRAGLKSNIGFNLRLREGAADWLRYFGYIFTPTEGDYGARRIPDSLSFLYFLYRPFRLMTEGEGH